MRLRHEVKAVELNRAAITMTLGPNAEGQMTSKKLKLTHRPSSFASVGTLRVATSGEPASSSAPLSVIYSIAQLQIVLKPLPAGIETFSARISDFQRPGPDHRIFEKKYSPSPAIPLPVTCRATP
jgi:hypothetical protein